MKPSKEQLHGWLALHCGSLDWKGAVAILAAIAEKEEADSIIEELSESHCNFIKPYWQRYQEFLEKSEAMTVKNIEEMSRTDFLDWARDRAEPYLERGMVQDAFTAFASDLEKHPKTKNHPALMLGLQQLVCGRLATVEAMRNFLAGFN